MAVDPHGAHPTLPTRVQALLPRLLEPLFPFEIGFALRQIVKCARVVKEDEPQGVRATRMFRHDGGEVA